MHISYRDFLHFESFSNHNCSYSPNRSTETEHDPEIYMPGYPAQTKNGLLSVILSAIGRRIIAIVTDPVFPYAKRKLSDMRWHFSKVISPAWMFNPINSMTKTGKNVTYSQLGTCEWDVVWYINHFWSTYPLQYRGTVTLKPETAECTRHRASWTGCQLKSPTTAPAGWKFIGYQLNDSSVHSQAINKCASHTCRWSIQQLSIVLFLIYNFKLPSMFSKRNFHCTESYLDGFAWLSLKFRWCPSSQDHDLHPRLETFWP